MTVLSAITLVKQASPEIDTLHPLDQHASSASLFVLDLCLRRFHGSRLLIEGWAGDLAKFRTLTHSSEH